MSLWGAQCPTPINTKFGGYCETGSTLGCTLSYKCHIRYDSCPKLGSACVFPKEDAVFSSGIKCQFERNTIMANCCPPYSDIKNYQNLILRRGYGNMGNALFRAAGVEFFMLLQK